MGAKPTKAPVATGLVTTVFPKPFRIRTIFGPV